MSEIESTPAVALFVQRARAARPTFQLREDEAPEVVEICYRLGGLPLALELAAARIKMLSPRALLNRLDDSLDVLTTGARDAPRRHQSLRDAIAWSYELLTPEEQFLFRQFGVFAGGFSLEAAEAVVEVEDLDALNGIASLVDKSLLRREDRSDEDRFSYLEAIREFASNQLREHGEDSSVRERHTNWYTSLAERLGPRFMTANENAAMDLLSNDHGNLSLAMAWLTVNDPPKAASLAIALWYYWGVRGHFSEARSWVERTLSKGDRLKPLVRARLHAVGGMLGWLQGDFETGGPHLKQAAELFNQQDDKFGIPMATFGLSYLPLTTEDYAEALAGFETALKGFQELGRSGWMTLTMSIIGDIHCKLDHFDEADEVLSRALKLSESINYDGGRAPVLGNLGYLSLKRGDLEGALRRYKEAFPIWRDSGEVQGAADTLSEIAIIADEVGFHDDCVRLLGAASAFYNRIGFSETRFGPGFKSGRVERLRATFDDGRFEELWREGQRWSLAEAADFVLTFNLSRQPNLAIPKPATPPPLPSARAAADFDLTSRELDIARLLVEGRSTSEIAERLYISPRTVGTHIQNILGKLDVSTRAAAVAVLLRSGIVSRPA